MEGLNSKVDFSAEVSRLLRSLIWILFMFWENIINFIDHSFLRYRATMDI